MTARVRRIFSIPLFLVLISSGFDCRHATEPPQTRAGSDTTSHDFFWRLDTLGAGSMNLLKDVAIVNDTCIWAVGEIYMRDSTGSIESDRYNAAMWNGKAWTVKRLTWQYRGYTIIEHIESVFAFSPTDIWLSSGIPVHGNGTMWTLYHLFDMGVLTPADGVLTKLWGTNSSNIYFVGTKGTIVHYDGSTWQKLSSGTDVDLLDVYGTPDGSTVWACGWGDTTPMVLLRIKGTQVETLYQSNDYARERSDSLSGPLVSVVNPSGVYLFVCSGYGLYQCPPITHGEGKRLSFVLGYFPGFPTRVRGNADNNLFIVGTYNFIAHYNGSSWRHYVELMSQEGRLTSVDAKGNVVAAVGYLYHDPLNVQAEIIIGRR